MANHDIQNSQHLLKRLEEEMIFLKSLLSQMDSLSSQVTFLSSGIKKTWLEIDHAHKDFRENL